MTTTAKNRTFHARQTGLTLPAISAAGDAVPGRVLYQGENFEVTPEQYDATLDRNGNSFLDLTPQQQVDRWGMQKFAEGPAPEGMGFGLDDDGLQYRLAQRERLYAEAISDPADRLLALKELRLKYPADVLHPQAQSGVVYPGSTGY